ncbi:hypothetical protein JCM6882_001752 [Rhodosporidiobolus microsporus]
MSTIAQYEAHAGAGDLGEGYKAPQGGPRYEEGKEHSHQNLDGKDERSHANTVAAASKAAKEEEKADREGGDAYSGVGLAEQHGNAPSKGAKIDAELQAEEEAELAKKANK